jgi:hypothetical protein
VRSTAACEHGTGGASLHGASEYAVGGGMKLTLFTLGGPPPLIRPEPVERDWMDASPQRFAYRCLPLNIATRMATKVRRVGAARRQFST